MNPSMEDGMAASLGLRRFAAAGLPPTSSARPAVSAQRSGMTIIVYSADLDRLLAALMLATGAATMGEVHLFFTFWATAALRKVSARRNRSWIERLFGWLLPRGFGDLKLSRMNMGGIGTAVVRARMRRMNVAGCEELLEMAKEAGVRISVCETSLRLLGLSVEDLIDYPGLSTCGVATFAAKAAECGVHLFI